MYSYDIDIGLSYKANIGLSSSSFCNCLVCLLGCVPVCADIEGTLEAADARSVKNLSNSGIELNRIWVD